METDPISAQRIVPEDTRSFLYRVGPVWNDDLTAHRQLVMDHYRSRLAHSSGSLSVMRDLVYGPDPAHRLDVFAAVTPCSNPQARPVVAFVHGGAFTRGSKSVDGLIYDNVLHWFARQGFVGVNVEYRLAPVAKFPDGARDVARAVEWLTQNIAVFGGDPQQILLVGHSAGGSHVASYLWSPDINVTVNPAIRAAVLIGARLRADSLPENPNAANVAAYFGPDPAEQDRNSPVHHAGTTALPVMLAVAEFENRYLDRYAFEFAGRHAARRGRAPRFLQMPLHNHTSIVAHFNTGEDTLGREILAFAAGEAGISACSACQQGDVSP